MKNPKSSRGRSFAASLLTAVAFCTAAVAAEPAGNLQVTTTKTIERFVPDARANIASIELRSEATVSSADVTLKQICRWPDADADAFAEVADLVVIRLTDTKPFDTLSIEKLQSLLSDAGLNPGLVNFAGAATCTVSRSDVQPDESIALQAWVGAAATAAEVPTASAQLQAERLRAAARRDEVAQGQGDADPTKALPGRPSDLRAQLIADVSTRLNLPPEIMQIDFKPEDKKLLSLAAPFEFSFEPQRYGDLGDTSWIVTVLSGRGEVQQKQRVRITANARAWTDQLVLARPVGVKQTISESDFEVKRVLAEKLSRDPLATKEAAIGQQAARELTVGTVLTTKMLSPVELVRSGQLVTVLMRRGGIEVKTVAVALQNGSAGQSIKVKNEVTDQVFQVTLTGHQTAVLGASDPVATAN